MGCAWGLNLGGHREWLKLGGTSSKTQRNRLVGQELGWHLGKEGTSFG